MRRLILAFLLFACAAPPLWAEDTATLKRIAAQIDQHAVIRAEFTQSKQMATLKRPLQSDGRIVFSRQFGVLWQIERPYRMSYVLGEDRIVEIAADGTRRERGLAEVPGLVQIGRIFRALLGADTTVLGEIFEVSAKGNPANGGHWEIDLVPKQAQLAQFLKAIHLNGGRFVEAIRIDENANDVTQIRFSNSRTADTPDAAELTLFGKTAKP